jgi:hypothetical protein
MPSPTATDDPGVQPASVGRVSIAAMRWLILLLGSWGLSAWYTWWSAHEDITPYAAAAIYVIVAPVLFLVNRGARSNLRESVSIAVLIMAAGLMALLLLALRSNLQALALGLGFLPAVAALYRALSTHSPLARRFSLAAILVFTSSCSPLPYKVWPWTEIRRQAADALVEHRRVRASMGLPPTGPLTRDQWAMFLARPDRWPIHLHPMFGVPYALDAQDENTALLSYGDSRASRLNAPDFIGPFHTYE